MKVKNEAATLDVLDSILDSISENSNLAFKNHDAMVQLPGFKIKEGKSSLLQQQIERNNRNSVNFSSISKSTEDEDKGIAEIMMLQQRTVLQVTSCSLIKTILPIIDVNSTEWKKLNRNINYLRISISILDGRSIEIVHSSMSVYSTTANCRNEKNIVIAR